MASELDMVNPGDRPHRRRSIRLRGHDYSSPGSYCVTICTFDRQYLFGHIEDKTMILNAHGRIVADCWQWLGVQFEGIVLDERVVMPNHLHGIIVRHGIGRPKPLGGLIGAFKTVTTKQINQLRKTPGSLLWQRNYWEHIIRDDVEMDSIRSYIANNPADWATDDLNVVRKKRT